MQKRIRTGFFALLLLAAVCFRVCAAAVESGAARDFVREKLDAAFGAEFFIGAAMAAEAGTPLRLAAQEEAPEPELVPAPEPEPAPAPTEPEPVQAPEPELPEPVATPAIPVSFTAEDAAAVRIGGGCSYAVDAAALLGTALPGDFSGEGPKILIIHTHASEAYTPEPGWEYEASDTLRTEDPNYSVIRVGREISDALNAAGIETIHDETIFDYPTYSGSYTRTLEAIEAWLAQYPSIQMVIDVHRDAASDESGQPVGTAVTLDGTDCARLMLVMGTDEGGLPHPGWKGNLSVAVKLQALLERSAPGLCRDLDLRQERFNQHATPCSMLVEVGSAGDTLAEALRAADYFADALIELLRPALQAAS